MNRDNSLDLLAAQLLFCRRRYQPRRPALNRASRLGSDAPHGWVLLVGDDKVSGQAISEGEAMPR